MTPTRSAASEPQRRTRSAAKSPRGARATQPPAPAAAPRQITTTAAPASRPSARAAAATHAASSAAVPAGGGGGAAAGADAPSAGVARAGCLLFARATRARADAAKGLFGKQIEEHGNRLKSVETDRFEQWRRAGLTSTLTLRAAQQAGGDVKSSQVKSSRAEL